MVYRPICGGERVLVCAPGAHYHLEGENSKPSRARENVCRAREVVCRARGKVCGLPSERECPPSERCLPFPRGGAPTPPGAARAPHPRRPPRPPSHIPTLPRPPGHQGHAGMLRRASSQKYGPFSSPGAHRKVKSWTAVVWAAAGYRRAVGSQRKRRSLSHK
jgi:hypothetical protein